MPSTACSIRPRISAARRALRRTSSRSRPWRQPRAAAGCRDDHNDRCTPRAACAVDLVRARASVRVALPVSLLLARARLRRRSRPLPARGAPLPATERATFRQTSSLGGLRLLGLLHGLLDLLLRRGLRRHGLDRCLDFHFVADEQTAAGDRHVPDEPPLATIERVRALEGDALTAPRVIEHIADGDGDVDRSRLAPDREVPGHREMITIALDRPTLEPDLGMALHVE